jgi:hypothetical protein
MGLRLGANAIMVGDNPDTMTNRTLIANLIAAARLPAMYPVAECVHAGGLMAYSFDLVGLNTRVGVCEARATAFSEIKSNLIKRALCPLLGLR